MELYDPRNEHDSCGVGLVASVNGIKDRRTVDLALRTIENMAHRGAENADGRTGDGAGMTVQIPHEFILSLNIPVPDAGEYGTGILFIPKGHEEECMSVFRDAAEDHRLKIIAERDVPVRSDIPGDMAKLREPVMKQVFIVTEHTEQLDVRLYELRRNVTGKLSHLDDFHICSLSSRAMVYKGMLTPEQLRQYYPDLSDPSFVSAIAMVHSRFSTNTMPSWKLAQPFRMICHNGEINTIRGNRSWMKAREGVLSSAVSTDTSDPILEDNMSDSASLDNVLEFMVMSGMSVEHSLSALIPESWNDTNPIPDESKAFYEYHSILMEPWDGPAAVLFTDGRIAGGMLDRNGLRPARYTLTKDGLFVLASEAGVIGIPPENVKEKGRLRPGKMLVLDTEEGRLVSDHEIKEKLGSAHPYREWLDGNRVELDSIRSGREPSRTVDHMDVMSGIFGYTANDMKALETMATTGKEPTGSMGDDTPLAILSERPRRLFDYFRQMFAQVTNPPIDPIREELVMSLTGYVGPIRENILEPSPDHCKVIKLKHPVLTNRELDLIKNLEYRGFRTSVISMTFPVGSGGKELEDAIENICKKAEDAVDDGVSYIILSDRSAGPDEIPIPSVLAVSAVHDHLVEKRKRLQTAIIVESGEPRDVMHHAMLFGYGANAVNPYMVFALLDRMTVNERLKMDVNTAERNYIRACEKGILKIISKMGIATLRSYRGAMLFEAVGISKDVTERYFSGTASNIGGIGSDIIAKEASKFHENAYSMKADEQKDRHSWGPSSVKALQKAVHGNDDEYEKFIEIQGMERTFIRDVIHITESNPIDINDVEAAGSIMRRFSTGAISFGSISREAHETLAKAMNSIGGKSNSGEGGEDISRSGTDRRSAIKQVASGRFGVTAEYLVDADEIQIKVAQGAKPGEGGQLMGYKVDEVIARTRHTSPGVTLISPPPHHDIYSIEDLAQLIFDLRSVNRDARISVKLVSISGVGTIAAGVAKAGADTILISGSDGGTGASPVSSIRYAGMPWETGLAETQQTLVMNGLRERVRLQADGGLKTGRDVIIAALLGAEEFGFATAPMVAMGCVMDRKCHTNDCPVGIATQDPERRKRFKGTPEDVVELFRLIAEDVRRHLSRMGFRSLSEIIGRADLMTKRQVDGKAETIDISRMTRRVSGTQMHRVRQADPTVNSLDRMMLRDSEKAFRGDEVDLKYKIRNTDRSVGAMLSGEAIKRKTKLKDGSIRVLFSGSAGQSFGAFLVEGMEFTIVGECNDYVGKGLSGGRIALIPDAGDGNIIAGNTILYGATSGEAYIRGEVGERFCVRNSGATAVAEGIGDHGCEYMTGGIAVILGKMGRNFAAGMSGGVAYVLKDDDLDRHCNMDMVELSLLDDADVNVLSEILEKHLRYTGSPKALEILNSDDIRKEFIKVAPVQRTS